MRVPLSWLNEYSDSGLDLDRLEHVLTSSGTKVEAIHHHGVAGAEHVVIGKVLTCEKHPDADRLNVTTVDVAEDEPVTIVCGAPNVAAGQTVVVARPGAVMPNGMTIAKAKLRGVVSNGMICSESELGIGGDSDGILALEDDSLAAGTPASEVVPISDEVIEFEITPNRPDCLGVYGIAREVHAATGAELKPAPWGEDLGSLGAGDAGALIDIEVACPELCPRFTARVFENVTIGPSPRWLRARLTAAGQRPINNVVDITNYAMLLSGHPLHAFDLDKIAGGKLTVRVAADGEQVQTLDDQTRTLDSQMVLIEDAEGPTSIAGVMGGARSEVSESTTRVLMEVASWNGPNIHRTAQKLALRSEASSRFAKGLAPEQALDAQAIATALMLELTGAKLVSGTVDAGPFSAAPSPDATVTLRGGSVERILGMAIDISVQRERLEALGFGVDADGDDLVVTVPPYRRGDVTREADLVEEVGRFSLDELPATLPKRRGVSGKLPADLRLRRRALDALVDRGASEIVGWSFTTPDVADRLRLEEGSLGRRFVHLENPMSDDHAVLRTTLLGSLLDAAAHNIAHGTADLTLTEQGSVYLAADDRAELPDEHRALGLLQVGNTAPAGWGQGAKPVKAGFFTAKALLEAVLEVLRVDVTFEQTTAPFLHPGRTAKVLHGDTVLGWIGEVHPLVAKNWDIDEPVAAFELDLDQVVAIADQVPRYKDLTSFPAVRQDLAVVVPVANTAASVQATISAAGGELLSEVHLFDVYEGQQLGEGKRSLAFSLAFQAPDRTLTGDEIAPSVEAIVAALKEAGGELRQ